MPSDHGNMPGRNKNVVLEGELLVATFEFPCRDIKNEPIKGKTFKSERSIRHTNPRKSQTGTLKELQAKVLREDPEAKFLNFRVA